MAKLTKIRGAMDDYTNTQLRNLDYTAAEVNFLQIGVVLKTRL